MLRMNHLRSLAVALVAVGSMTLGAANTSHAQMYVWPGMSSGYGHHSEGLMGRYGVFGRRAAAPTYYYPMTASPYMPARRGGTYYAPMNQRYYGTTPQPYYAPTTQPYVAPATQPYFAPTTQPYMPTPVPSTYAPTTRAAASAPVRSASTETPATGPIGADNPSPGTGRDVSMHKPWMPATP